MFRVQPATTVFRLLGPDAGYMIIFFVSKNPSYSFSFFYVQRLLSVDFARYPFEIWRAELLSYVIGGCEDVVVRLFPLIPGFNIPFRKPPSVCSLNYAGMNCVGEMGNLCYPATTGFNKDFITFFDTVFFCGFRMNQGCGIILEFS